MTKLKFQIGSINYLYYWKNLYLVTLKIHEYWLVKIHLISTYISERSQSFLYNWFKMSQSSKHIRHFLDWKEQNFLGPEKNCQSLIISATPLFIAIYLYKNSPSFSLIYISLYPVWILRVTMVTQFLLTWVLLTQLRQVSRFSTLSHML